MTTAPSRFESLSRAELATLLPELLLIGQMIDRSGMAWCISNFGREEMLQIAIEEWAGASPIYTKRMQRALKFEGDDVPTIFKGMQLDIGAPPQFMDFRYVIHDRWHGEFYLDHCGALLDVEPMGDEYVRGMCHDIEDPTFDATAVATNPRTQIRPIHRPPRTPADRHPHCAWTVIIDESHPEVAGLPPLAIIEKTHAAIWELAPIDPADEGQSDYSGPLVSDFDFTAYSKSALVRLADEVCLQMQLLNLSYVLAVKSRATDEAQARDICTKQLIGLAGLAAERIHKALKLSSDIDGALRVLELHPLVNPNGYVDAEFEGGRMHVHRSVAHDDGTWISLCTPGETRALQAIATAVDPHIGVHVTGTDTDWTLEFTVGETAHKVAPEVEVAKFSGGATFVFEERKSLPLTVV
ncbi:hypothetical protein [[Mycobacterium] wendilense]|uniref:Uncharacterized protein n=1 Tax=[Mycobacterium] wendilense TaxID=3064284 RepID=A0ABM9MIP0_9MYCO|nr:hypothetical protein [Mycolicibacterium sp. MU0050]CAJ1586148.1 hypothetical protein MU0050_004113 [Mycolicibacterium sp. MU0050]